MKNSLKKWRLVQCCETVLVLLFLLLSLFLMGCDPALSSPKEVARFNKAGPVQTAGDFDESAKGKSGPYRVVPGDVLEFQMHVSLRIVSSELPDWFRPSFGYKEIEPYLVRVSDEGTVTLPIIGDIQVAGKTLAEIEKAVKKAYYPKYVAHPPMLVCQVKQYQAEHERVFTVMGLVNEPDAYPYPPDVQYNLMEALAFAGGLDIIADPQYVKVFRQDADGQVFQAVFGIGSKGLKNAYAVTIKPGDVIYVDHTLSTRMNKFLAGVFHITVGATAEAAELD
ncbi:MAG: polysaccharide biosynthesis/export family protein [Sedimentisphaerales bacterium]|nr:polysaccharide biosynthesis/export family protein [Sedimentisphaerales bacterium]